MSHDKKNQGLDPKQEQLIFALLKAKTKEEAASISGINPRTMYRWLANPRFMAAYRAAKREIFEDAIGILHKESVKAAQVLAEEMDCDGDGKATGSRERISAAAKILLYSFKGMDAILIHEELAHLRATIDAVKNGGADPSATADDDAPATPSEPRKPTPAEQLEHLEAVRLRMAWMRALGYGSEDIALNLRFNRPQSVNEEQGTLDLVHKLLEAENQSIGECSDDGNLEPDREETGSSTPGETA